MSNPKRGPNLFVHGNVSDAAQEAVLDGLDAGFTIDEIVGTNNPKITRNPDTPYPWETPPDITNPKEALEIVVEDLLETQAVKSIVSALAGGLPVGDIAMAVLYNKFIEGVISIDLLMLLAEPTMYLIMAIGEEADIRYNIEDNDMDEFYDKEDEEEEELNSLGKIKQETLSSKINENSIPKNILDKVKEQGPEIRSMLSKGEK